MLDIYDYVAGWTIYIVAGAICYIIFYRFTSSIRLKPLANSLRGILLALMFTPWYISAEDGLMAPALIVVLLDMVTIGGSSFVRATVPLILALIAAVVIALSGSLFKKVFRSIRHPSS